MKIAICCEQNSTDSMISVRFGRSPWIGIYDDESGQWDFIGNTQNLNAAQGAGIQTAQNILNSDAKVVLTCNAGPKAMKVLQDGEVVVYEAAKGGSISECLSLYKSNSLKVMEDANVEGHWV